MIVNPTETLIRSDASIGSVDVKQRLIDLIAVPWDQEAEVPWRGEIWREVFRRGAFDGLEDSVGRVRVNREHVKGDTVGRLVSADTQAEQGLLVRAKIARTPRGDETLELADDDMISPSVGYRVKQPDHIRLNSRTKMREVLKAFLDHLGMVESPAFAGAQIVAVRAEQATNEPPPPYVAKLESAWADPAYLAASELLEKRS